uniref:NADH dehydrogenase subunit 6 n=1 Tax=Spirometra erinaceieuropaei TaxID=99802 RepID=A0A0D3M5X8_SPIER|nr:NADH dehydrogenase subunit 6 [Spirometra erinaceieuropaei]
MVVSLLILCFVLYFGGLVFFCLINHPIYYCLLLILNSLISCFAAYICLGFSWYSLLFCLVYVGGVYILFVFVSVYSPNTSIVPYWNLEVVLFSLVFVGAVILSVSVYFSFVNYESSFSLCTWVEGYFYICLCLALLFGFFVLSFIMSVKSGYYR